MFHINPESGEPGVCRARTRPCPFGGPAEHFSTKEEAREAYEERQALLQVTGVPMKKSSSATDAAFASSLSYSGETPRWFRKLPTVLQESIYGCKPELIDVVQSPIGPLAVVWEDNSVEETDVFINVERGYNTTRLTFRSLETGEVAGYLKVTYVDEESVKRSFGEDSWRGMRYLADAKSFDGMETTYPKSRKFSLEATSLERKVYSPPALNSREALESFIAKARWQLSEPGEMPPNQARMSYEELTAELEELKTRANGRLEEFKRNYAVPHIDSSRISHGELRGKGMGHALYVYSARKLAEKGLPLRASTLQSEEAKKTWQLMAADPRFPISVENSLYEVGGARGYRKVSVSYMLDFRD